MDTQQIFLENAIQRFQFYKNLGDNTINQLSDEQLHWQYNETSNSIAIIAKHLSGNMHSRWTDFLTSDGEKEWRNRDDEFIDTIKGQALLKTVWESGWTVLFETLYSLSKYDLMEMVYIRSESHTVWDAIQRQLTHYAYHVGQMVAIGKMLKGEEWQTLSIPKGKSEEFNEEFRAAL